jgi:hypothetical protein
MSLMYESRMPYGLLSEGPQALTPISLPPGAFAQVSFFADNGLQGLPPAQLRVSMGLDDGTWQVEFVQVDSSLGQTIVLFPDPKRTTGLSIQRVDAGDVHVAWAVT